MRQIIILLSLCLLFSCTYVTPDNNNSLEIINSSQAINLGQCISKEQALNLVDTSLFSNCNILISNEIILPQYKIEKVADFYSPNFASWLIFIDLKPNAYWGHDCIYYFVNANTGEVSSFDNRFPPDVSMDTIKCVYQHTPQQNKKPTLSSNNIQVRNITIDSTKWAVILGGGYDGSSDMPSIQTECREIYIMLRDKYRYSEEQIIAMYTHLGTSLDLDYNTLDTEVDYIFNKEKIDFVFNYLSSNLEQGDTLSIFVMTHGDTSGNNNSSIILFEKEHFTDFEFAAQINKIPNNIPINVIMGQCHSGGFIDNISARCKHIVTSCSGSEVAYPTYDGTRSEFYRHWLGAMNDFDTFTPSTDADVNQNRIISFQEAFDYTTDLDRRDANSPPIDSVETRQFHSRDYYYTENYGLSSVLQNQPPQPPQPPQPLNPILTGSKNITLGQNVTYTISDIQENTTIIWNIPQYFSEVSRNQTTTSATITLCANRTNITTLDLTLGATISNSTETKTRTISDINIWKSGINISENLITGNINSYGGIVQLPSNVDGAYGYTWSCDQDWIVLDQGYYIAEFMNPLRGDNQTVTISVEFINPIGQQTTFVRTFTFNQ